MLIALLFSVREVAGQTQIDSSANTYFLGCKAFVEGRPDSETFAIGNVCSGIVHALAGVAQILPPNYQACIPATLTLRQLTLVVLKYIEARPQRMNEDFRVLSVEALHNAWPCDSQ
jgi:hypothetical protein